MKFQKLNIATGRIRGLKDSPSYYEARCFYSWDITFHDTSTFLFDNIFIKVGKEKEESEIFCNQLKENFKEAQIYDGDRVAVIFDEEGSVLAIGSTREEDVWIDTTDKCVKKTFAELDIIITSLTVY